MCAWLRQRADFKIEEFSRIIEQKGYIVTWERATVCPCLKTVTGTGQPDFNCVLCSGKGRFWHDAQTIKGIMTNFNEDARYNQAGETMAGTSYFTTLATNKLGFWDRLTNTHSQVRYSEIITKGDERGTDKTRFIPLKVDVLRTVTQVYDYGIDFTVDGETGVIDWAVPGNEPARGEQYSVEYLMHPRWIVIDLPNVLRDTYVKTKKPGSTHTAMPVKAVVRLEFFVM